MHEANTKSLTSNKWDKRITARHRESNIQLVTNIRLRKSTGMDVFQNDIVVAQCDG